MTIRSRPSASAFFIAASLVTAAADAGAQGRPGTTLRIAVDAASGSTLAQDAVPMAAQPSGNPVRLTLAEAIARGTAASHRMEELREREAGAAAALEGRAAADRPLLSASGGYTRTNHIEEFGILLPTGQRDVVFPDLPDNFRVRADLQWTVYNGGRFASLERAAAAELHAAGKDTAVAASDLRLEITRVFWSIVTAAAQVRVVEESVSRMDAHLTAVRGQFEAGLVPPNEVLTVEAQRLRQQLQLLEARNAQAVLEADLRRLTGLQPDGPLALDAALDPPPPPPPAVAELAAEALRARPEREALVNRIASFGARREAAAAGKAPIVTLAAGVDYANPNRRILPPVGKWRESWDVGVNASWSLWDGGRVMAEVAEAAAAERAAQTRLDEFDSVLQVEVRQRRLDLVSSLAAIDVAAAAVHSASEARRVVANRYEAGVINSVDVLDAQVALLQAELDRTRALATAQLSQARLERAIGR